MDFSQTVAFGLILAAGYMLFKSRNGMSPAAIPDSMDSLTARKAYLVFDCEKTGGGVSCAELMELYDANYLPVPGG